MIRIGLLGASRISHGAVIRPASEFDNVAVRRIAARDPVRAGAFAGDYGIEGTEPDYAALVSSDAVDLVYNALPPSEHARWTIAALEAGKHVLCEKPFAMNAGEARLMVDTANASPGCLIEAFHYRFHPLFDRVLAIVGSGAVGTIRRLDANFDAPIHYDRSEIRYRPELGGGSLMDLGCYPLHWVRTILGTEPEVAAARADWHASGVDVAMDAELRFPGDIGARVRCSMDESSLAGFDAKIEITGEAGRILVDNPLAPHDGNAIIVETADGVRRETVAGEGTTYLYQLRHVLDVIAGTTEPLTGGADAIANMAAIDTVYALAR